MGVEVGEREDLFVLYSVSLISLEIYELPDFLSVIP